MKRIIISLTIIFCAALAAYYINRFKDTFIMGMFPPSGGHYLNFIVTNFYPDSNLILNDTNSSMKTDKNGNFTGIATYQLDNSYTLRALTPSKKKMSYTFDLDDDIIIFCNNKNFKCYRKKQK